VLCIRLKHPKKNTARMHVHTDLTAWSRGEPADLEVTVGRRPLKMQMSAPTQKKKKNS